MTQQIEGQLAQIALRQGGAKIKLVTVHGTGAGAETATGDRWWQLGGKFLTELTARIDLDPSRVEVVPFQWEDGPNSEAKRRQAGDRLYAQLKSYDDAGEEYYVVGHSHGGSVAYNALLKSVDKASPLTGLKCWCTIGTPFLDYRAKNFMIQRMKSVGLSLYSTGIISLVIGAIIFFKYFREAESTGGPRDALELFGAALMLYGVLCVGGLYLIERYRRSWYSRRQKKKVFNQYSKIWIGFWHVEDEAISALTNIKHVSGQVIPTNFLFFIVSIFQLGLVIVAGSFISYDVVFGGKKWLTSYVNLIKEDAEIRYASVSYVPQTSDFSEIIFLAYSVSLLILVFLALVWLATRFLYVIAYLVGYPLSKWINGLIWASVRQRAWGDDLLKEDVKAIGSHPPEFPEQFGPLPDAVSEPLRGHSEKHAILTLHKVRMILGMAQDAKPSADIKSELSESLKWQELIHTSYFDVPEFVDLLALRLHRAGLGDLKQGFTLDGAARDALDAWCDGKAA